MMHWFITLLFIFVETNGFVVPFSSKIGKSLHRIRILSPFHSVNPISNTNTEVEDVLTAGNLSNIVGIELNEELKTSFMSYAMSTILGRALPDARDGLKPVHRRVLYAMNILNLYPDSSHRKCARIVGEVLGKFHPHGDQSVYDALVRMAQDFVMLHPLVAGQGNFGSVDADPAAAMRYTEAKLSSLAYDALLADIREDTTDMIANFDGNEMEPMVLPARLPMLFLNGASGIAVGMATNIPPNNLGELADAMIALIADPDISDEDLLKIIPAPDFPTGGRIIGLDGAKKLFLTGHGGITIRAKCHVEVISNGGKGSTRNRNAIIVTELPYLTNKSTLLEKIANLVNEKKLDGVSDLRDESDRDGIRVVIELKRDAIAAVVQNNLFKKTALQVSFSGNMLALTNKGTEPQRVTLREGLKVFIAYRFETLRRRTAFKLHKCEARDHLVQGMLKALKSIDDIVAIMTKSKDAASAKDILMSDKYGFSAEQAESVLGLTLRRLTAMEEAKLLEEHEDLLKQIGTLGKIMTDDKAVYTVMKRETLELKKKHAVARRSEIVLGEEAELSDEDLLANDRSVIIITRSGYIKRLPIQEFESQSRGGKGKAGAKLSTESDTVGHFFSCNDHDTILFISDRGIAYSVKAYQIPIASRIAKGTPLPQVLPIGSSETITSVIPVDKFNEDEYLLLLTQHGFIKKTKLKAFQSITARGLTIISLGENDKLKWSRRCKDEDDVLICTKAGFGSRFAATDINPTGRTSRGVIALNLRDGDTMADVDVWKHEFNAALDKDADHSYVLAVTEKGYGKRINIDHFRTQKRGGKGQYVIKFKSKADADALCCMRVCNAGDEVVLSTKKGTILRQSTDEITSKSRKASGFTLQRIAEDDAIVMVDIVPAAIVEQNRAESNRHNSEAEEGEESFSHSIVSNNEQSEMENAFVD